MRDALKKGAPRSFLMYHSPLLQGDGMSSQLDSPKFKQHVLERLKNHDEMNDIIIEICESANVPWEEARAFAEDLYEENKTDIVLYQSPVWIVIALATFIAGATLLVPGAHIVYAEFDLSGAWVAIMGIAMMLGSIKGMGDVWLAIFKKIGIM